MTAPGPSQSKDIQKELGENALLIGRVTMQWTTIQAAISQLFRRLSGLDAEKAEAVFFAVKSDSSQRDMTLALARIVLKDQSELLRRVIKLFNLLGELSGERNAVTHAMWAVKMPEGRVTPMPRRGQHRRLKIQDHRAQFDQLIRDLSQMFRDLVKLESDIRSALTQQSGKPSVVQLAADDSSGA
jgi:hypothetical protein